MMAVAQSPEEFRAFVDSCDDFDDAASCSFVDDDDWQWEERLRLTNEFDNWTTGNDSLDLLIQQTQLENPDPRHHMQWVPFDQFVDVKHVKNGGYSTVYSAIWSGKTDKVWDAKRKEFFEKPLVVALKEMKNSESLSEEFIDEFRRHSSLKMDGCGSNIVHCHGITRNPDNGEYMTIMNFAEEGDLRQYVQRNYDRLRWKDAVEMLTQVATGLMNVHKNGSFHKNLHSSNILKFFTCNLADFGLNGPVDDSQPRGVYGSLPFVAPEVLAGEPYSQKADVYSFAYVMWELSAGCLPFADRPHDHSMALDVCHGLREAMVPDTPLFYQRLMTQCWDADPDQRPDVEEIVDILLSPYDYHRRLLDMGEFKPRSTVDFRDVSSFEDMLNSRICMTDVPPKSDVHPFAVYTSRYLLYPNLPSPHNSEFVGLRSPTMYIDAEEISDAIDELGFEEYDTHQPPPELSDTESDDCDEEPYMPPPPMLLGRRKSILPPPMLQVA